MIFHQTLAEATLVSLACLLMVGSATAQRSASPALPMNLFVRALTEGTASAPLPERPEFQQVRQQLERLLGSQAPLELRAMRVVRFSQQPNCGRVAFGLWQPETRRVVAAIAGQLNICEDGRPPLQECPAKPGTFVPSGAICTDAAGRRQPAQDTSEVRDAIAAAVARGGLSVEQIRATRKAAGGATP